MIKGTNFLSPFPIFSSVDANKNETWSLKMGNIKKEAEDYNKLNDIKPKNILDSEIRKKRIFTAIAVVGMLLAAAALATGLVFSGGGLGLILLFGLGEIVSLGIFIYGVIKATDASERCEEISPYIKKVDTIKTKMTFLDANKQQPEKQRYNELFARCNVPAHIVEAFNAQLTEKNRTIPLRLPPSKDSLNAIRNKLTINIAERKEHSRKIRKQHFNCEVLATRMTLLDQNKKDQKEKFVNFDREFKARSQIISNTHDEVLQLKSTSKTQIDDILKEKLRLMRENKAYKNQLAADRQQIENKNALYANVNFDLLAARLAVDYAK